MKIILIGYMASGKTTIGKILSESLQLPFYDLDFETERSKFLNKITKIKGIQLCFFAHQIVSLR
jgi:shikimate kinase